MEERTGIMGRLRHAYNAFVNQDSDRWKDVGESGSSYAYRPDRVRTFVTNERSLITSIMTRVSIDVATHEIRHVKLDEAGRYKEDMDSGLNECLTVEANLDQAGRAFRQDMAWTILNEGVAAVVPVDTTLNPEVSGSWDVKTMRVGNIIQWFPAHVKVSLYNEANGRREDLTLAKRSVAIMENPLYGVMNEPNSTLQRIIRKLNYLDAVDEASSSGKLDILIQLPYVIKSPARKQQAEQRRKDIEWQLKGSKYGIAYTDGTEKITQLNRPAENNLLTQIEFLVKMLYGQLGLTEEVMNGTADEATMLNYMNRTIEPLLTTMTEAMIRSFLTKTARTQKQSIKFFKDPFRLVPISNVAEIADKFTRNEIMTSNEFRQVIGMKPSTDPKADELRNSNMPQSELRPEDPTDRRAVNRSAQSKTALAVVPDQRGDSQNGSS
jgi:hypothetical protein